MWKFATIRAMKEFEPRDPVELLRIREKIGRPAEIPEDCSQALSLIARKLKDKLRENLEGGNSEIFRVVKESNKGFPPSRWVANYIELLTDFYVTEPAAELIESQDHAQITRGAVIMDFGHGIQFIARAVVSVTADYQTALAGFKDGIEDLGFKQGDGQARLGSVLEDWSKKKMLLERDPRGFLLADKVLEDLKRGVPIHKWEIKQAVVTGAETCIEIYKELYPIVARTHRSHQN